MSKRLKFESVNYERNHNSRHSSICEKKSNKLEEIYCADFHNHAVSRDCYLNHNNTSSDLMRLNRAIAATGLCSRRKADELILAGKVSVNGKIVVNPGTRVVPTDQLFVGRTKLNQPPAPTYVMLNKPIHTVCTMHDPEGRRTVIDLLPEELRAKRLFPVGRLDYFSEGLLLLTNDGELAQRLAHPRHQHVKLYEVLVREPVSAKMLQIMRSGMSFDAKTRLMPVKATASARADGHTLLSLELRQGINRQIRRMCKAFNLTILRLVRVAQSSLQLGDLPSGQWRFLTEAEILKLRGAADS